MRNQILIQLFYGGKSQKDFKYLGLSANLFRDNVNRLIEHYFYSWNLYRHLWFDSIHIYRFKFITHNFKRINYLWKYAKFHCCCQRVFDYRSQLHWVIQSTFLNFWVSTWIQPKPIELDWINKSWSNVNHIKFKYKPFLPIRTLIVFIFKYTKHAKHANRTL